MSIEKRPDHSEQNELVILPTRGEDQNIEALYIPELGKEIPVFNLRNLNDHSEIARRLTGGQSMAMYGGVWGGFKAVKRAYQKEEFFYEAKPGRPKEAKIPMLARPEEATRLIDWSRVHEDFRHLKDSWNLKKLWSHGAFLHLIAPVRESLGSLPHIFVTSPEEFTRRYPNSPEVKFPTIAAVYREDPYLRHLSAFVERFSHTNMYIGVSTLNPHGEEPAYTFEGLLGDLRSGKCNPEMIDFIVSDKLYESYEAHSSHTQMRIPLVGEKPAFKVLRIGSFTPFGFEKATGFKTVLEEGSGDVRKNKGESLDSKLEAMTAEIRARYEREKPLIYFRTPG